MGLVMTETRWTAGPWTVVTEGGEYAHGPETECGKPIVRWTGMCMPTKPEGIANAYLIAAAPDLYSALLSAEQSIATFMGVHGYSNDSGAGDILAEVKAALAKARGEQ